MDKAIDLNCDMGESFGLYRIGHDDEIMTLISSANIACGFHAGDPDVMDHAVMTAGQCGVSVGAHPGYPDLAGFGRRFLDMGRKELINAVIYQVGALQAFCRKHGVRLRHVKPHGSLGNKVDADERIADAVAEAVALFDPSLALFVKPNTKLHRIAETNAMRFALEMFADREYNDDLTLVSRAFPGAVIIDPERAAERVMTMVAQGKVTTWQHREVGIRGHTVCVHGDTPTAVPMIRAIRERLEQEGYAVTSDGLPSGL